MASNDIKLDSELLNGLVQFNSLLNRKLPSGPQQQQQPQQQRFDDANFLSTAPRVCPQWMNNIKEVLFSEAQIRLKVREMGQMISKDYAGKSVLVIGLLNGAFVFVADLLRELSVPYELDFMVVSSYGSGTKSSGQIRIKKDLSINPAGKHILIVEDLCDTGHTLKFMRDHLQNKECASVRICTLLDKKARRDPNSSVTLDYVGFECPDEFVVGYGMDFAEQYRCLPFVAVLKPEAYAHIL